MDRRVAEPGVGNAQRWREKLQATVEFVESSLDEVQKTRYSAEVQELSLSRSLWSMTRSVCLPRLSQQGSPLPDSKLVQGSNRLLSRLFCNKIALPFSPCFASQPPRAPIDRLRPRLLPSIFRCFSQQALYCTATEHSSLQRSSSIRRALLNFGVRNPSELGAACEVRSERAAISFSEVLRRWAVLWPSCSAAFPAKISSLSGLPAPSERRQANQSRWRVEALWL